VSYVNCKTLTSTSLLPTFTPLRKFVLIAYLTNPDNPSVTTRNKNGTSGSSYLSPLVGLNSIVGLPLTRTETEVDSKHPLIHITHL